jgi:tRNA nucleotidyltransferase (CCA-adding enzyme)
LRVIADPKEIPVPPAVLEILRTLEGAGFESWCVGGAIRDALLGNLQQDVDIATAASPTDVRALFRRTVPIGIEHGTVGVLDDGGVLHEVTTFRRDVRTDGRHAVVAFGVSLDDDLARRDFTVNAIAYHPMRHEWRDPFGGRADLARGVIRCVGDAASRFREDRLRILRGLRFAARFDFTIEPDTWAAAREQAPDIAHLSAERVREEWAKGIATAQAVNRLVELWDASGVAAVWLPELAPSPRHDESNPHLADADRDPVLVTAFYCAASAPVWRRLKGSLADIRRAEAIDRGPKRPVSDAPRDVRHWMALTGAAVDDLRTLAIWAGEPADRWPAEVDAIRRRGEPTARGDLAVTGDDLVTAGIPIGPAIGKALSALLDAVLDDPARNTRETLLALARESR